MNGYEITKKKTNTKYTGRGFLEQKSGVWGTMRILLSGPSKHKIIHVATNDLTSKKESTEISSNIKDLALKLKPDTFQVSLSNLTARNDQ